MAAHTLLAIEVEFGDATSLRRARLAIDASKIAASSKDRIDAVLFEFGGLRDSAWQVMARDPQAFAALDTVVSQLSDRGRLAAGRMWQAGWPLYIEGYNARLTVHRARVLGADVLRRVLPFRGISSGPQVRPTSYLMRLLPPTNLIRWGLPAAVVTYGPQHAVAWYLDLRERETLLPEISLGGPTLSLDLALTAGIPGTGGNARSGFVAQYYDDLLPFPHQVVRYQRAGRTHIDTYAQVNHETSCPWAHARTGYYLLDNEMRFVRQGTDSLGPGQPRRLRYEAELEPGAYVYSIELLDSTCHAASRERHVVEIPRPTRGLSLSDIVLADSIWIPGALRIVGTQPMVARAGLAASPKDPLRLYWEIYGVSAQSAEPDRLAVSIEVLDIRKKRVPIAQLGNVQRDANGGMQGQKVTYTLEVPRGAEPLATGLAIRLPSSASGVYTVRVTVTDRTTGASATASRSLYVAR